MQFDLFHSIGRVDSIQPRLTDRDVLQNFLEQAQLADELDFQTLWVAESHFSSEVQKNHKDPVIPNYTGEVGLNTDSCQLAQMIFQKTNHIGFGTAIYNIVGGNGGPIGAADRIRSLAFLNSLQVKPRKLDIGVAQGRFPYINRPFGIIPRNEIEERLWPIYQRLIFLEALEIFLRLSLGETISSQDITSYQITADLFRDPQIGQKTLLGLSSESLHYQSRWSFDALKLIPNFIEQTLPAELNFVLGSTDPLARQLAMNLTDIDLFNLSFTPPDKINALHSELTQVCQSSNKIWHRQRLPRTVLVFIDPDQKSAEDLAHQAFDTYIQAMQGTIRLPPKETLMQRALIGNGENILKQLTPEDPHGFHANDRLMLWFEFSQADHQKICSRMRYFSEEVMAHVR